VPDGSTGLIAIGGATQKGHLAEASESASLIELSSNSFLLVTIEARGGVSREF